MTIWNVKVTRNVELFDENGNITQHNQVSECYALTLEELLHFLNTHEGNWWHENKFEIMDFETIAYTGETIHQINEDKDDLIDKVEALEETIDEYKDKLDNIYSMADDILSECDHD